MTSPACRTWWWPLQRLGTIFQRPWIQWSHSTFQRIIVVWFHVHVVSFLGCYGWQGMASLQRLAWVSFRQARSCFPQLAGWNVSIRHSSSNIEVHRPWSSLSASHQQAWQALGVKDENAWRLDMESIQVLVFFSHMECQDDWKWNPPGASKNHVSQTLYYPMNFRILFFEVNFPNFLLWIMRFHRGKSCHKRLAETAKNWSWKSSRNSPLRSKLLSFMDWVWMWQLGMPSSKPMSRNNLKFPSRTNHNLWRRTKF